jgi:hypothetical protein
MNGAASRITEFMNSANPVVTTIVDKTRVAAEFLPKYELPPTAKQVTLDRVVHDGTVDDVATIPLAEIWLRFAVDWQQLAESDMRTALGLTRIAAQTYSRLEDRLLFLGQDDNLVLRGGPLPPGARVDRGSSNFGLLGAPAMNGQRDDIYAEVARAYGELETQSVAGPFALVMGSDLFDEADRTPAGYVESPRRRIENLLGRMVQRSSVLPAYTAVLVGGAIATPSAPAGVPPTGPVDRAVAVDPELRHLGNTDNQGRYEFWVVGALALRLKDSWGVVQILFD